MKHFLFAVILLGLSSVTQADNRTALGRLIDRIQENSQDRRDNRELLRLQRQLVNRGHSFSARELALQYKIERLQAIQNRRDREDLNEIRRELQRSSARSHHREDFSDLRRELLIRSLSTPSCYSFGR